MTQSGAWAYLAVFLLMVLAIIGIPAVGPAVVGWAAVQARGRAERRWNAAWPASKLDSGLCLVFAGDPAIPALPWAGRLAGPAPVPTWKGSAHDG